jgi:hypothetical protein
MSVRALPVTLAATVGRKPKETIWLQVRLLAIPPERVAVLVEYYDGLELGKIQVVHEGTPVVAIRAFNDAVESLKGQGFRGLTKIEPVGDFDVFEAALRAHAVLAA